MNLRKLVIEDIRCFAGRHEFNIRPLTFLAGENSTGKSTALGCIGALDHVINETPDRLSFNKEPYQMGAFADIVRKSRPVKKSFRLGFSFQNDAGNMEYILTCEEREKGAEAIVSEEKFIFENGEIICKDADLTANHAETVISSIYRISHDSGKAAGTRKFIVEVLPIFFMQDTRPFGLLDSFLRQKDHGNEAQLAEFLECFQPVWQQAASFSFKTQSFAPIRSRPQRTYNPQQENLTSEGSDIPVLLRDMSKTDSASWEKLKRRLLEFGKTSGLFTDINVRKLGKSMNDPFQLQIKITGPGVNLMDVGYGVNQILPIVVKILQTSGKTNFLVQQPEVHLHPKGQAALSSLMVDLIKQKKHDFIVETHSDYMIDRARIEIMNGKIAPEDVSLVYLETAGNSVKVHNIEFDQQANLLGAPGSYRDFFLKESDKLLGFDQG